MGVRAKHRVGNGAGIGLWIQIAVDSGRMDGMGLSEVGPGGRGARLADL